MSDSRKKRLSMLDNMASAAPPAPETMMSTNRALRSARDAVDGHNVWELDPRDIEDHRPVDRLDHDDTADLQDAIEANGQTVPILVRRHPEKKDRYLLVYGRRRLEAIRRSDKVDKVRALIANLDDDAAVKAQVSENMARRDLTFIEKALFARELVDGKFGSQQQVADVLTVTKSAISMALAIVDSITPDLARAIGPAQGVGRPRWEALAKSIESRVLPQERLIKIADDARSDAIVALVKADAPGDAGDPSVAAFEAVFQAAAPPKTVSKKKKRAPKAGVQQIKIGNGAGTAEMRRTSSGLQLNLKDSDFADWLEQEAKQVLEELHVRWINRAED